MERRDLIRKYVKQGMIVDGKVINYVHIIAANETEQLRVYGKARNGMICLYLITGI